MALVPLTTVEAYCGAEAGDAILAILHPAVEEELNRELKRELESGVHRHERYNGSGANSLLLKNYPLTNLERVSIGTDNAMTIVNNSTDASNSLARVSVPDAKLSLQVIGGTNEHAWQDFGFTAYATFSALIAAVNSFDHDWVFTVIDTDYNSYPSTDLIDQLRQYCQESIALEMPYSYIDVSPDFTTGIIRRYNGNIFVKGTKNVIATYTGGFSTTPADLVYAVCQLTYNLYLRRRNSLMDGTRRYSLGKITLEFYQDIARNPDLAKILERYRRRLV